MKAYNRIYLVNDNPNHGFDRNCTLMVLSWKKKTFLFALKAQNNVCIVVDSMFLTSNESLLIK